MRRHADSGLLARRTGPVGTHVPDAPRSTAQRAGARRGHGEGGGQPVSDRARPPARERPVYGTGDRTGHGLHPVDRAAPRRYGMRARRARRGQGYYGALSGHPAADPTRHAPIP